MSRYEPENTVECPICGRMHADPDKLTVCTACNDQGWWIDPAGGTHQDDSTQEEFIDPAKMYE
jgi:hypothetical protein